MEYSFYYYGFVNFGPRVSDVIKLTFSWSYLFFFFFGKNPSLPSSLWVQFLFAIIFCPSSPCLFLKVPGFQSWVIPSPFSCCPFPLFSGSSCSPCSFLVSMERIQRQLSETRCAWKMPLFYPDMLAASDFTEFQCPPPFKGCWGSSRYNVSLLFV